MQKIDINEILEGVNLQENKIKDPGQLHYKLEGARGAANHLKSVADNMESCLGRAKDAVKPDNDKSLGMVKHYIDAARVENVKKQLGDVEKKIKEILRMIK